ncbi:MAG: MAPEG family protein [Rhodoferax sp.]|uniref:MAPEG family protein n=1 Tax=Rhodoferax sp. TaxID=50421 RepID=UPI002731B68F|nr:MAPEG family protein [Rhodoferax sp.]MDP1529758.1 MAPEG family protein [Rhodoferax sp.]
MIVRVVPESASIVAAVAAALVVKNLVLSYVQVVARYRARSFSRPEDARLLGLAPQSEPDLAARAAGALRNEAENSPFFLALATANVLLGGPPFPLLVICCLYVIARLFQGYAQVKALQPQRMIAYLIGVVTTLGLAVLIAVQVGS